MVKKPKTTLISVKCRTSPGLGEGPWFDSRVRDFLFRNNLETYSNKTLIFIRKNKVSRNSLISSMVEQLLPKQRDRGSIPLSGKLFPYRPVVGYQVLTLKAGVRFSVWKLFKKS